MKRKNNTGRAAKPKASTQKPKTLTWEEQIRQSLEETKKSLEEAAKINEATRKRMEQWQKERENQSKTNHCKHCLFQKECPLFTPTGIMAIVCTNRKYDERVRELIKEGDVAYDRNLIYWDDTQEELDRRFNLS